MKTLKHIIKGQFESIEELITVSLDHWTALYFKLGKVRASLHITADIKRRNHLGESYAYEFVNIVLRRIVLQHEEIMAHIENNPVGTDGYTNSGTPTDKTYQDAKRELEGGE